MEEIRLLRPTERYAAQVMEYQKEMFLAKSSFDGCAGLEDVETFAEWMDFEERGRAKHKDAYVPEETSLAVRKKDNRVIGMIDFRHSLSDFLFRFGGHVGCSVRPSERGKGYAAEMLRLLLPVCREFGEGKILITCDKKNEASRRTILKNGGVLENEIIDITGMSKSGIIERYWIQL